MIASATETVNIRNTIVRDVVKSFQRFGTSFMANTGTANLSIHYTDYDPGAGEQSGAGAGPNLMDPTNPNVDPQFVDAPSGDLRLVGGSPLIDAGDPAALALDEPATDSGGNARVVDGNGDGTARRDIGALEYQRNPPAIASVTSTPTQAQVGVPFAFAAAATDPDGDPITYAWSFDDGTSAPGASVQHTFTTPGIHVAKITVTDAAGRTAVAAAAVGVTAAPTPVLGSLKLVPSSFRPTNGTDVRFALNLAGRVKFTVDRTAVGRRVKGKCVRATNKNRAAKKCTRHLAVNGSFARNGAAGANHFHWNGRLKGKPLKPGSYRLIATVGSGPAKNLKRVSFKVKR
jgi:hypothetical protein